MSTTLVDWWALSLAIVAFLAIVGFGAHRFLREPADEWTLPEWQRPVALDDVTVTGLPIPYDEWQALDPDAAADTFIAELRTDAEWHADDNERTVNTDTMGLLDDQELLLWDCRKQLERIRTIREDYRVEMAVLLAQYRAELEHRGVA